MWKITYLLSRRQEDQPPPRRGTVTSRLLSHALLQLTLHVRDCMDGVDLSQEPGTPETWDLEACLVRLASPNSSSAEASSGPLGSPTTTT